MLQKAINKFQKLAALDPRAIMAKAFENPGLKQQVVDWQQYQLYEEGVDAAGNPLGNYSPFTVRYKMSIGARYDHITLNDTGAFYGSMQVLPKDNGVVIAADTQKPDVDLAVVYPKALGLTEQSKEEVKPILVSVMFQEIRKAIA